MNKLVLAALMTSLPLLATANRYQNNNIQYGQVIEVQPIYQTVSIPEERQVCEQRRSNRYSHSNRNNQNNAGRAILGGIIGGAIGNRFGSGNGRDASTALGILIGAGVGASKGHQKARHNCYIETNYYEENRFMGYDVTYDFNGSLYHTQVQEHPGDRIRLRVNVDVLD